jgi:hypothetical protein
MTVINLQPGNILNVHAGQIRSIAHVYRTSDGYDGAGSVSWAPNGGALQIMDIAVGQTVTFAINSQAGMIANGAPSKVQVLYDNGVARDAGEAHPVAVQALHARGKAHAETPPARRAGARAGDPTPAEKAVQTFTAQWYNAIVTGLSLDPSTFQLVQGNQLLGATSETMWAIYDVVPPRSASNFYNPSQAVRFSQQYGSVVLNLIPQGSARFQTDLGDYYGAWALHLKKVTKMPAGGLLELFKTWAEINVPDPGVTAKATADLSLLLNGTVPVAQSMWLTAGGPGTVKAYNGTITTVTNGITQARSGDVTMNSATESSDLTHTWASGEVGGVFDFFEGGGSGSYDSIVSSFSAAGLNIQANFQHVLTAPLAPLTAPSTDPILAKYNPWYDSAALTLAYGTQDNTLWQPGSAPTWQQEFGPTGALLRTTSALVIVDGIDITITSTAVFSSAEQQQIEAAAEAGFWPFFEAEASGGWTNKASFNSSGQMTLTSSMPAGNPTVLGAIVTPISAAMMLPRA